MCRLIVCALAVFSLGGGSDTLGPVTTCDGNWLGTQNGYNMGLTLTQTDTAVSGVVQLTGNFGFAQGTVSGTCSYPAVNLLISVTNFDVISYTGTMSQTAAVIQAKLNGSGFVNLELDVDKK